MNIHLPIEKRKNTCVWKKERRVKKRGRREEVGDSALSFPETAEALLLLCTRQPGVYLLPPQVPFQPLMSRYPLLGKFHRVGIYFQRG